MQRSGIIPWNQLEAFVRLYNNTIASQLLNEQEGILTKAQIEPLLPPFFKKLHSNLSTIVKDHLGEEVKKEEEELEKGKIRLIIKVMSTIKSRTNPKDLRTSEDMATIIKAIKPDIKDMMGNDIPNDVIEKTF